MAHPHKYSPTSPSLPLLPILSPPHQAEEKTNTIAHSLARFQPNPTIDVMRKIHICTFPFIQNAEPNAPASINAIDRLILRLNYAVRTRAPSKTGQAHPSV